MTGLRGAQARHRRPTFVLHGPTVDSMCLCMRTTIELNDDLLRRAKRRAADDRTTLREVIEQALRAHLTRRGALPRGRYTLRWRTERGTLQPGVRLDDRDALFDLMDGRT